MQPEAKRCRSAMRMPLMSSEYQSRLIVEEKTLWYSLYSLSSSHDSQYPTAQTAAGITLTAALLAAAAFGVYSIKGGASHLYLRLALVSIVAVSVLLLFLFRPVVRILAASVFIGLGAGVYCVEALSIALTDPDRPALQVMEATARKDGIAYDGRTRLEVLADMHSHGVVAWPPFYPYLLLNSPLRIGDQEILPLGSLANARTICCNESGQYLTYTTDEHGFRNPPGSWSNLPADVAIVGASSAVSECVDDPDSLVTLLRARYPRTITVGAGGNGPLLELASIREYLPTVKPRLVLWLYGEVHTPEYFEAEVHNPLTLRYLDPSFTQGLAGKQDQINHAVANYFERGIREGEAEHSLAHRTRDFAALKDTRMLLYYFATARSFRPNPRVAAAEFDAALYERALLEGVKTVSQWGGTVALVYWPDSSRYPAGPGYSAQNVRALDESRDKILAIAKRNAVPTIDLSHSFPENDSAAANARFFYPFPAHFKPAGYHLAARQLIAAMAQWESAAK
jgi:hypothetical protein